MATVKCITALRESSWDVRVGELRDSAAFEVTTATDEKAKVFLAPGCHELLTQLGWTPPTEDPS